MKRVHDKHGDGGSVVPRARTADIVVEALADELLVYDLNTRAAHCLSAVAARVWRACDGATTRHELASRLDLDAGAVAQALEELERCSLLDDYAQAPQVFTRRELNIRVTKVGAAAASIPFIVSLAVPAIAAATPTVEQCRAGFTDGCGDCKLSGCCCCGPGNGSTKDCVPTATCGVIAYPLAPKGSTCSKTNK